MSPSFLFAASALALIPLALLLPPLLLRQRSHSACAAPPAPRTALGLSLVLPLLAAALYALLGSPAALQAHATPAATGVSADSAVPPQVQAMVERLSVRLAAQPDDAAGRQLYIRAHETLGRPAEALRGYQQLDRLLPPDATRLSQHAVTLAMAEGSGLAGAPEALIQRALQLDPQHPQALALAGSAALERDDRVAARRYWQRLLAITPADSEAAAALRRSLAGL